MTSNKDLKQRRAEEIQHVSRQIIFSSMLSHEHLKKANNPIPSKEQMRQHLSEDFTLRLRLNLHLTSIKCFAFFPHVFYLHACQ